MVDHTQDEEEDSWVVLQACPEPMGAQVLAGRLQADGIPARVSTLSPLPGLEQNAEVHVPRAFLARAQQALAAQRPSEEELAELAARTPPEDEGADRSD
ncbi:MAG: hypothetical protein ACP5PN_04330 [Steroidobacteraceae bacterium]